MGNSRTILFFSEAVTLAHVARPYVLAQALLDKNYHVHFAANRRFDHFFLFDNFRRYNLVSISSSEFLRALASGRPPYNYNMLLDYINEDLKLIDKIKPDVIVGDFRLSLAISAKLAQIPYVSITNAYWSPYAKPRFRIPSHPFVNLIGVSASQFFFDLFRQFIFAYHSRSFKKVSFKYGLSVFENDLCEVYTQGDYVVYADASELVPTYNKPPNHKYIGPILWSPPESEPPWWREAIRNRRPKVYVNLGSSGRMAILSEVLAGLSDIDVSVLTATTSHNLVISNMPNNVYLSDYLSGDKVTKVSDIVICNGGSMSVQQALMSGVPVIGIAHNLDQYLNMHYIEKSGAGILLRSDRCNKSIVRHAVLEMLNQKKYRENAAKASMVLKDYDSSSSFASLIDSFLVG